MAQRAYQIAFGGTPAEQDLYGDVLMLRIEESISLASTFELQLATKRSDTGVWDYLDDARLALLAKVSIKVGFTGSGGLSAALGASVGTPGGNDGLIALFDGYVTSVNLDVDSQPGNSRIEVCGMDTSVLMSLEEKIATWQNMSDSEIAQQILGGYNVAIQADSTATVHQQDQTTIVQRASDVQFVRDLAQRNGMEFYFQTDPSTGAVTAYFQAPQLGGKPQPDLSVQFGDQSNLRSFSARLTAQRPLAVKIVQIDVSQNSANTAQVTDTQLAKLGASDANALVGGPLSSLVNPKDVQAQMLVQGPPTSNATEMQTIAQAVRDEAGWFIDAQGEINSEAYQAVLRPHRLVLVKGAGNAYSGKYYVTRVEHELKGDGSYTQRFEARRNARDVDGSEQFAASDLGLPIPGN
jgi:hypothetical protein